MLITYPVTKPKNLCAFCIFCIFRRSAAAAAVGTTSAGRFLRILRTIKLISADGKTTYFASTISCPQLSSARTCQSLGAIDFISRRVRQLPLLLHFRPHAAPKPKTPRLLLLLISFLFTKEIMQFAFVSLQAADADVLHALPCLILFYFIFDSFGWDVKYSDWVAVVKK